MGLHIRKFEGPNLQGSVTRTSGLNHKIDLIVLFPFLHSKGENPGFPGFYPPGVFGSPGDLGSSQCRLTAQHGTAGSTKENFPIFHHQKFNRQFSHQNGIVVRVVSALWGGVVGQVRSKMLPR